MLQDLHAGRLENEFQLEGPEDNSRILCVQGSTILASTAEDGTLRLPEYRMVRQWCRNWEHWAGEELRYGFRMEGISYFLWMGEARACPEAGWTYRSYRDFRQLSSRELCYGAMTAWHLYVWYRNNRFCGRCGGKTVHDSTERMVRCPDCGNLIFPRISPAVIVGVTNGEKILLTRYAGRGYTHFALIAGYTEIGETMEQTVQREVLEEVGLRIKNIRYYKSQPWGVDGNVLMGFYCDVDGEEEIHLDQQELSFGEWFDRKEIPIQDDGISLTREMIRVFQEGNEPQ